MQNQQIKVKIANLNNQIVKTHHKNKEKVKILNNYKVQNKKIIKMQKVHHLKMDLKKNKVKARIQKIKKVEIQKDQWELKEIKKMAKNQKQLIQKNQVIKIALIQNKNLVIKKEANLNHKNQAIQKKIKMEVDQNHKNQVNKMEQIQNKNQVIKMEIK